MTPMHRPPQQNKSGMAQAWEAFATVAAIAATFILAPIVFQISKIAVQSWATSQYGSEWIDAATLLCGIVSAVVVYWAAYMLVLEFFIKRFMRSATKGHIMAQQYRKRGQIDVYEPVPPKNNSGVWVLAIGAFVVLAMLSQCAG